MRQCKLELNLQYLPQPLRHFPHTQNEPRVDKLRVQVDVFRRELSTPAAFIAEATNKRGMAAGAREAAAKQLERCLQVC